MVNIKSSGTISKEVNNGLIKLVLLFWGYQLLLHTYFTVASNDPRLFLPTSIAFLHDLAILGITTTIVLFIKSVSPITLKKSIDKVLKNFIFDSKLFLYMSPN